MQTLLGFDTANDTTLVLSSQVDETVWMDAKPTNGAVGIVPESWTSILIDPPTTGLATQESKMAAGSWLTRGLGSFAVGVDRREQVLSEYSHCLSM